MAAVCGIVCLLVLSTTHCSKPETPPADAAAVNDTVAGPVPYSTLQQTGTIRAGTIVINLDSFQVSGQVWNIDEERIGDTLAIDSATSVSITSVSSWYRLGSMSGVGATGLTEQPTKVAILPPDTDVAPVKK
jgi:hypothetical protein